MNGDILFLAHRVPYPPNRGDKIRSWNILKGLAKVAPVHVCALWDDERDLSHIKVLNDVAASVSLRHAKASKPSAVAHALITGGSASVAACASRDLAADVGHLMATHRIGTVFAFSGQMAQFVPAQLSGRRFVMDFVDMDSAKFAKYADQASGPMAWANRWEANRLFAHEVRVAKRADISLFVSEAEAALFQAKSGLDATQVRALENGIDLDHFHPDHNGCASLASDRPLVVFTGQMDYAPNVAAVEWFAQDVMPLLPNMTFAIVGRSPTPAVQALARLPHVIVTGEVPDTRDWIASANVVVAPLLLARGIQNKILEAMAMAKPVVATPAAAEGIDAVHGTEIIVAKTGPEQAQAIQQVIEQKELGALIGRAARARMVERYSWEARLSDLPQIAGKAAR